MEYALVEQTTERTDAVQVMNAHRKQQMSDSSLAKWETGGTRERERERENANTKLEIIAWFIQRSEICVNRCK